MRPFFSNGDAGTPASVTRTLLVRNPKIATPEGVVAPLSGRIRAYPTFKSPAPSVIRELTLLSVIANALDVDWLQPGKGKASNSTKNPNLIRTQRPPAHKMGAHGNRTAYPDPLEL